MRLDIFVQFGFDISPSCFTERVSVFITGSPSFLPLDVVTSSQYLWTLVKRHLLFAGVGGVLSGD